MKTKSKKRANDNAKGKMPFGLMVLCMMDTGMTREEAEEYCRRTHAERLDMTKAPEHCATFGQKLDEIGE